LHRAFRLWAPVTVLASHGIVEGQNLILVSRSADGHFERLDSLAAEIKAANVAVIVTAIT